MFLALAMAAAISLPPVEQCDGDPAFDTVRAQFAAAVRTRNVDGLAAISGAELVLDDIGEDRGVARLRAMMAEERGPDFWRMLEPAADSGCAQSESTRLLPSFAARLSGEEMLVAGAREPIRAGPDPNSPVIGHADWELVDHNFADSGPFYWHVRLRSGRTGYVRSERVYSNLSPYAAFKLRDGRWQLITLRLLAAD